jgi:uncharacterized protein YdeI (BOF family)
LDGSAGGGTPLSVWIHVNNLTPNTTYYLRPSFTGSLSTPKGFIFNPATNQWINSTNGTYASYPGISSPTGEWSGWITLKTDSTDTNSAGSFFVRVRASSTDTFDIRNIPIAYTRTENLGWLAGHVPAEYANKPVAVYDCDDNLVGVYFAEVNAVAEGYPDDPGYFKIGVPAGSGYKCAVLNDADPSGAKLLESGGDFLVTAGQVTQADLPAVDTNPPVLRSVTVSNPSEITALFHEAVQETAATTVTNYQITGNGLVEAMIPTAAAMGTTKSVILTLPAPLPEGQYALTANGILDLAGNEGSALNVGFVVDITPPTLNSVEIPDLLRIRLTFSEKLDASATNAANYTVTPDGSTAAAIKSAAVDASGTIVTLTMNGPMNTSMLYHMTADVADVAGNAVSLNGDATSPEQKSMSYVHETNADGTLVHAGEVVRVQGVATVNDGILGGSTQVSYYIQDATGGVNVFQSSGGPSAIKAGDRVDMVGTITLYNGLAELVPVAPASVLDSGNPLPQPAETSVAELNAFATAEPLEGKLAVLSAQLNSADSGTGNRNVTLKTGEQTLTMRVIGATGINLSALPVGTPVRVTGIVSQYDSSKPYDSGYQIFPRSPADIEQYVMLIHTPVTQAIVNTGVAINAQAYGATSATLYYRSTGAADYTSIAMTAAGNDYTATIPSESVTGAGVEYYMEATDGTNITTAGTAAEPYAISVITDVVGPTFSNLTPQNGATIDNPRPTMSAKYSDPSGVEVGSVTVQIDGAAVTPEIVNATMVTFRPAENLSLGSHTAKVAASDIYGNSSEVTWTFTVESTFAGGYHYYGSTHNHTMYSHDGAGSPEDAVQAAMLHGYNWFAFTDHSHDIDAEVRGTDTVANGGDPERSGGAQWQDTRDTATASTVDGEFVVFPAFEMTSTSWGHSNVFGTANFIDREMSSRRYNDPMSNYYDWLLTHPEAVGQFNHPGMPENSFNGFLPYDPAVDELMTIIEVGNGSGHYSYSNFENYYYKALDLGWHVAPTFGEDNHDATWGQTLKRTVIVAPDLTQASLLKSMHDMRVYMVEDPDFSMDVTANGFYMGSTVDPGTLAFNIHGWDASEELKSDPAYNYLPDTFVSDDDVARAEILSAGGEVVASYEPTSGSEFTWTPVIEADAGQWFVVKITQDDGQRMYSSPIWTTEAPVDIKVNDIRIPDGSLMAGTPAVIEAGVSNLGSEAAANLTVSFYYDLQDESHLIGTYNIAALSSKANTTASVVWADPVSGAHTLIAALSSVEGDNPEDNSRTLDTNVGTPLGITVMIDASHGNENSSRDPGKYKNNMVTITTKLRKLGYTVIENAAPLTAETLGQADVVIMTYPTTALTPEDNAAVAAWVQGGGNLFLLVKSNNSADPTAVNNLLQAMQSGIRTNNDGVFDLVNNFWSNPASSPWAVAIPNLPLVDSLVTDKVSGVDYYSGDSLVDENLQALTDGNGVSVIMWANSTTYQDNLKGSAYAYRLKDQPGDGSIIPLAAQELIGYGRLAVAGMNVMNDKQLDESFGLVGNDEFTINVIDWLAGRGREVTSVAAARELPEGTSIIVQGIVTTPAGRFFDAFYLQDETGGIMAYNEVPNGSLELGDIVRVYGHRKVFEGNDELEFGDFVYDVIKVGHTEPVEPRRVTTGTAGSAANAGMLVSVRGLLTRWYDANSFYVDDGTGEALVFTDGYIANQTGAVPAIQVGDVVEAAGLAGKFADGDRIRVRDTAEIVDMGTPAAPALVITLPRTGTQTSKSTTTVRGTTNPGAEVTVDGAAALVNPDGTFTYSAPLDEGWNYIEVVATGEFNLTTSQTIRVYRHVPAAPPEPGDLTPPDLKVDQPTPAITSQPAFTVSGTTEPGASVTVNSETVPVTASGSFETNITLTEGPNSITITAADANGNETTKRITVVLDTVRPELTVSAPVDGIALGKPTVTVMGIAVGATSVQVNADTASIGADGRFTAQVTLHAGENLIVVTARDDANNNAKVERKVTYASAPGTETEIGQLVLGDNQATVNGQTQTLPQPPVAIGGRTLAPVRFVAEALGAEVTWRDSDQSITIKLGNTTISMNLGSQFALVNGEQVDLGIAPQIVNRYSMLPLRALSEILGIRIEWNEADNSVHLYR